MADILLAFVLGIVFVATVFVGMQLVYVLRDVSDTLKAVTGLSNQIKHDIEPTMKEVNEILAKVNGTMEHLETLNEGIKKASAKANVYVSKAKEKTNTLVIKIKGYLGMAKEGAVAAKEVLLDKESPPPVRVKDPPTSVTLSKEEKDKTTVN